MKNNDYNDLKELLLLYEVRDPRPGLVIETKRLMREELTQLSAFHSWQAEWVVMLVGLALVMTMGLFYSFTVGMILSITLPSQLTELLQYSFYVFAAAGGSLIAGVIMVFYFKQLQTPQLEVRRAYMRA